MFKNALFGSTPFVPGFAESQHGLRLPYLPVFAADDGTGGGSDDTSDDSKSDDSKSKKTDAPVDDKEAKRLARELAGKQKALESANGKLTDLESQLKRFDGIDPEQVRALLEEKAKAEDERKKAEEDRLKAAGDFEALKKRMADQHQKDLAAAQDQVKAAQAQAQVLQKQIHELTIGAAFASSAFIRDEMLLPPAKARRAYEDHFEIGDDGQLKAFDAPAGSKDRTPLVDSRGRPLPFDEALKQIIDADPDRDHLLKAKGKPGSGQAPSKTTNQKTNNGSQPATGVSAIALALAARNKK